MSSQVFSNQPVRDQERLAQAIVLKAACAGANVLAKSGGQQDAIVAAASSAGVHAIREAHNASLHITYLRYDEDIGPAEFAFTATLVHTPPYSLMKRSLGRTPRQVADTRTITEADLQFC